MSYAITGQHVFLARMFFMCHTPLSVQRTSTRSQNMRRPLILAILAALVGMAYSPAEAVKKPYKPWSLPTSTK